VCPGPPACHGRVGCGHEKHPPGSVELDLAVPVDQALCSDFDLWHFALNGWYLPDPDERASLEAAWAGGDDDATSRWEEAARKATRRPPGRLLRTDALPAVMRAALEASWRHCIVGPAVVTGHPSPYRLPVGRPGDPGSPAPR
jgi:hypothetical protein